MSPNLPLTFYFMRSSCLILFLLSFSIHACAPTGGSTRTKTPLPPGMKRGMIWEEAVNYGYTEDIYITPDIVAEAKKGARNLLFELRNVYKDDRCKNEPSSLLLRYVVSRDGDVIGVHPQNKLNPGCKDILTNSLKQIEFYPALYNDKKVHILMAITINDRRF